jgi:hypothetical protein
VIDQVTGVVLAEPVTVAVNCCVCEEDNVIAAGATVMPMEETEHASDIAMALTLAVALEGRVHMGAVPELTFSAYAAVLLAADASV